MFRGCTEQGIPLPFRRYTSLRSYNAGHYLPEFLMAFTVDSSKFKFSSDLAAGVKGKRVLISGAGKDGGLGQSFALAAGLNGADRRPIGNTVRPAQNRNGCSGTKREIARARPYQRFRPSRNQLLRQRRKKTDKNDVQITAHQTSLEFEGLVARKLDPARFGDALACRDRAGQHARSKNARNADAKCRHT